MNDRARVPPAAEDLAELLRAHGGLLFGLAYGVLRDHAMAEDVCQEALLRAWERRGELCEAGSLRAWLARIVLNESLRMLRRRKAEQSAIAVRRQAAREDDGPPDTLLRDEVLAALERLRETTRLVVVLRIMNDASGKEVKDLLGCSAAEVSRQLHHGMQRLRELLVHWRIDSPRGSDVL